MPSLSFVVAPLRTKRWTKREMDVYQSDSSSVDNLAYLGTLDPILAKAVAVFFFLTITEFLKFKMLRRVVYMTVVIAAFYGLIKGEFAKTIFQV